MLDMVHKASESGSSVSSFVIALSGTRNVTKTVQ